VFGLDPWLAGFAHGASPSVVLAVALLLGLRHASDPDHLVAVSTLVATEPERRVRRAGALGLSWGLGHATSLLVLGIPFVLTAALLPPSLEQAAEVLVGGVIMVLALRLFLRWRDGAFHAHLHRHGPVHHRHLHRHAKQGGHAHGHRVRSPLAAYGIGLVHGLGGSAGIALLLLAGIADHAEALAALVLFVVATAASMAILSSGFGLALGRPRARRRLMLLSPALACAAFVFGALYATAALGAAA
jgi:high-affinity nickel permease